MQGPPPKPGFDVDHVLSQLKQNEKIALLSGKPSLAHRLLTMAPTVEIAKFVASETFIANESIINAPLEALSKVPGLLA